MQIKTALQNPHILNSYGNYINFVNTEVAGRWLNKKPDWRSTGEVYAFIYNSLWVTSCPFCPEQIIVEPDHPFYCPNCLMTGNDGKAMDVIFPDKDARDIIEALLIMRPDPSTRSWHLVETANDLAQQNIEHGLIKGAK